MIAWLTDQVNKLWAKISSVLSAAYSYAASKAAAALSAAVSWAEDAIASARAGLQYAVDAVRNLATSYYNSLRALIGAVEIGARVVANLVGDAVRNLAWWLYDQAVAFARGLVSGAEALISAGISAVRSWVLDLAGDILEWWHSTKPTVLAIVDWFRNELPAGWSFLKSLIALLDPANLKRLADLLNRVYLWFVNFLEDPVGYIAAFVLSFFIPMLCDEIAHAMGTVKYDLPPRRTYGKSGFGGGGFGGTGPPPGASGLAAPLDSLYVSGYLFGPGHPGIDLGLTMSAPVYAMHDGQVVEAGWSTVGYGMTVVLEGDGWRTRYGHLSAVAVSPGDRVRQSQQIGLGDSTGNSTGPHLHLEIYWQGKAVNPIAVLPI